MTIKDMAPWIAIVITLILSILIPLFTQIANNRFQIKMKKMDIKIASENKRLFAYEEYFQKVGGCILYTKQENMSEASASIQRLYTYLPEEQWVILDKLFDNIKEYKWEEAQKAMKCVSKWIANDMKLH